MDFISKKQGYVIKVVPYIFFVAVVLNSQQKYIRIVLKLIHESQLRDTGVNFFKSLIIKDVGDMIIPKLSKDIQILAHSSPAQRFLDK